MERITPARPVKLSDLARAAGVSKGTASNVFNRHEVVRSGVRERVLDVARTIGYRGPDPKGRLLSAGKVNAIGVATIEPLSYFFSDPYARVLMTGITEACDASGVGISLVSAASEEQVVWNLRSALVDGFILFCLEGAERLVAAAHERKLPFVAIDFGEADRSMSVVGVDNKAGAGLAARHLAELGHRRYAILAMEFGPGGPGRVTPERLSTAVYTTSSDRVAGCFAVLESFGIDTGAIPIFETASDAATIHPVLEELFAAAEPPTAIIAQSDLIAMIALDWLRGRSIAVPGQVSVTGFDGVPESATSQPPLTTVQQPIADLGRRAVRAILDHGDELWREIVEVALVIRQSTAPPPDA